MATEPGYNKRIKAGTAAKLYFVLFQLAIISLFILKFSEVDTATAYSKKEINEIKSFMWLLIKLNSANVMLGRVQ